MSDIVDTLISYDSTPTEKEGEKKKTAEEDIKALKKELNETQEKDKKSSKKIKPLKEQLNTMKWR